MIPLNKNVVIKLDKTPEKIGKIIKPNADREKPSKGTVVSSYIESPLKKGTKVMFKKFGAIELDRELGVDLVVVDEEDLILIYE